MNGPVIRAYRARLVRKSRKVPGAPRKVRSNKGTKRASGVAMRRLFRSPVARKVRSNKGAKRGPRRVPGMGMAMASISPIFGKMFAQRKTRKNKGVKRGPRWMPGMAY